MITKYFAEEGDTIEVGGQFLEIDTDAKAPAGGAPKQEAPAAAAVSTDFILLIITHHLILLLNLGVGSQPNSRGRPVTSRIPTKAHSSPGRSESPRTYSRRRQLGQQLLDCQEGAYRDHRVKNGDSRQDE